MKHSSWHTNRTSADTSRIQVNRKFPPTSKIPSVISKWGLEGFLPAKLNFSCWFRSMSILNANERVSTWIMIHCLIRTSVTTIFVLCYTLVQVGSRTWTLRYSSCSGSRMWGFTEDQLLKQRKYQTAAAPWPPPTHVWPAKCTDLRENKIPGLN